MEKTKRKGVKRVLKVSMEELSALNLALQFITVEELLSAAMRGFVDTKEEPTQLDKEKSDLCWKILKTLR